MRYRPGIWMTIAILLAFLVQPARGEPLVQNGEETPAFVPGQLIIGFRPGVSKEEVADFYATYGLAEKENLDSNLEDNDQEQRLASVQVDVTADLISILESDPRVRYAEPNYLLHIAKTPNDPHFDKLWGLRNVGQTGGKAGADVSATNAWDISTGSKDVLVVIIDTGIDFNHEDLAANMWVNPKECPQGFGKCNADGKDDDGNGYTDDFYGANTINDTGDIMDDFGHGTHVAGTIGGVGNNSLGVVGVNWNVRLIGCKFLSASGSGTTANAIKCFQYVNDLKNKQGYNILLTNNSWGGGQFSEALRDAMGGPNAPLHACAAGNSNTSRIHYPSGYDLPNIIAVAATDHDDMYASFSNYGDWVDFAAPGVDIFSTVPKGSCAMCDSSGYREASGTSMATPHVAGAAALLWSKYPTLTAEQVKSRLFSGVVPLADRSKTTITNGRMNLLNAMEDDQTAPAAITNLAVSGVLMTQVQLGWTATGDDGLQGTANAYDLRYSTSPISDATWKDAKSVEGVPAPQPAGAIERFTVSGLQPATTYYFAMKVVDNVGNLSDLSNIVVVATSAGTIVFEDSMENGANGWTVDGTDNLWHLSELRSTSPTHAWYYGKDDTRNYDTGKANRGTLTSPVINLVDADEVLLTFNEWSQVQTNEEFDRTRVQVSTDGESWQTIFESHGTNDAWANRSVSLSSFIQRSGAVYLRYSFDTVNDRFNNFEGWYLDDVRILVAKLARPGEERPAANLVARAENIGFNPANPMEGDKVTIHAAILNNGLTEANDVTILFTEVISGNAVPIGAGTQGAQTIATIPAGGSGVAEVIYDTTGKTGERTIQVLVDPGNFIGEISRTDNSARKPLLVTPRPAPNLVIEAGNIGFDPATPNPGDQVTIFATIRNDGNADAADVQVQFVDATGAGTAPIGPLQTVDVIPAGGNVTLQVTFDTNGAVGDRDIGVVVDPNNAIAESRESDNSAEKKLPLILAPAPNLVMLKTNIGFAPVKPTESATVTIRATVLNDGNAEAKEVLVQFVDATANASTPIGEQQTIAVIPAGGSGVAEVSYDTANKAGDRKIRIVVDPHNFVTEAKETDNTSEETLKVALRPTPNLVVQAANIGFNPANPIDGDTVTVYATIVNNGNASASDVQVQFVDVTDGGAVPVGDRQSVAAIAAGQSSIVQVNYPTADKVGERTLQVVVDPGNFIAETDETDNVVKKALRVAASPMPNLVMTPANVKFNPPDPIDQDKVAIHAVVLNTGAAAAHKVLVQFIDMTTGVAVPIAPEQFIDLIPIGGSGEVDAMLDLMGQTKDRKIQVLVDSNNLIEEINERDNTATLSLPVAPSPAPNLVVQANNIGFAPTEPRLGEPVTVSVVILNNGSADAQNVVVQFADVTNGRPVPIGEPQMLERIAAGGSGAVQVTYLANNVGGAAATAISLPGERKIRVVVDPNNFIRELDEIDNKDTATVMIAPSPAPNLVVQASNIGFAPPLPTDGEPVSVTVTILNAGVVDAHDVLVQFVDISEGGMIPVDVKKTIALIPAGASAIAQVTYTTLDKEGARKIQVLIDPHTTIPETNENDNSAIQTLTVAPAPAPNLVVQANNIGFSPTQPLEGDKVTIRATIINNGVAAAEGILVQFVDASSSNPTPIDANQVITNIPAGGSGVAEVTYDTTGKTGTQTARKIQVIADRNNLIVESNENDNTATQTLNVTPQPAPNLMVQVSNIGFDPAKPNPGDQVTIFATILNNGTTAATDVLVQFVDATVSGATAPIGQPQTIEAIPAGSSGVVQIVYDTTNKSGERKVQVIVDPNNFVRETSETDNNATKTLAMVNTPAPNLVMNSNNLLFTPSSADLMTLRAIVLNDGNAAANDVVVQFLDVSENSTGVAIGQPQLIDNIAIGGSGVVQVSYDLAGKTGERKIKVVVDPNNFIAETKETDNAISSKSLFVPAAAGPNLAMHAGNIGFNPGQPVEGARVTIHAVIVNNGLHDANDISVQFIDVTAGGAQPIGTPQVIDSIPAGNTGVAQLLYDTSGASGERRIEVLVDPSNFIPETDESDNTAVGILTIASPPAPNLMVLAGNVKFSPSEPTQGQPVTVTATVLNGGSADATDVVVQVLDVTGGGARPVGAEQIIDELPTGANATVQLIYDNTDIPGERQIQVTADPNDTIDETEEEDNRAVKGLTISPPKIPNLAVQPSGILFSKPSPVAGDQIVITATVLNNGNVEVSDVLVHVVDVTDGGSELIGGPQTITKLSAGASASVVVNYDTTDKIGDRKIRVTADPANSIIETEEGDNETSKTLKVKSPDEQPPDLPNLKVLSGNIKFEPATPTAGTPVTITVSVLNEGKQPAALILVRIVDVTDGGNEIIGQRTITDAIPVGESAAISLTYDTTGKAGDRQIQVTADPDNTIEETDETDNQVTKPLKINAAASAVIVTNAPIDRPELAVQIDTITVETLGEGDNSLVTMVATVSNNGAAAADKVLVQFSGTGGENLVGMQSIERLPQGAQTNTQMSFVFPGQVTEANAERTIEVVVDPYNAVAEANETDNRAEQTVDLLAGQSSQGIEAAVVK